MPRTLPVCLALLLACGGESTPPRQTTPAEPPTVAAGAPARLAIAPAPTRGRAVGAPHTQLIATIVTAPDGPAALTQDGVGNVRLWPDLAAAAESRVVPAGGAQRLSLAGTGAQLTVGYVDAAGAGHLLRLRGDRWRTLWSSSPADPLTELAVLPGGKRALALANDRTLRLLADDGDELARLDQRGARPEFLALAADGSAALAYWFEHTDTGKLDLTGLRVRLDQTAKDGAPLLAAPAAEIELTELSPPLAMAPDAGAVAMLEVADDRSSARAVVVELASGERRAVGPERLPAAGVHLAFVGPRTLAIRAATGPSWLADERGARPLFGLPVQFANGPMRAAGGLLLSGAGRWLAVHDTATGSRHYLGHELFQPQSAAVDAGGQRVAWIANGAIYVEETAGDGVTRLALGQVPGNRLAFVGEEHLLVLDTAGGVRVIAIASGQVVSEADAGGMIADWDFDPERGLLALRSTNAVPILFELGADRQLRGPHLAPVAARASGLVAASASPDAPVLWAHDGTQVHRYSLRALRRGIGADAATPAQPQPAAAPGPTAGSRRGHLFTWNNNGRVLQITGPDGEVEIDQPDNLYLLRMVPSPDGRKLALMMSTRAIEVWSTDGRKLWSRMGQQGLQDLVWSPAGDLLATAGTAGGGIYRAADGAVVRERCGVWFERRRTAPPTASFPINEQLLCEP